MNTEVADLAIKWIIENPEQHNQRWFAYHAPSCGTTLCFAGVVAMQAGWELDWRVPRSYEGGVVTTRVTRNGRCRTIRDVATDLLDIDADEATALFMDAQTLSQVRSTLAWISSRTDDD